MPDKILVTCASMLRMFDEFGDVFAKYDLVGEKLPVQQHPTEEELIDVLPNYDGWILGDDPATRKVVDAGASGKLRAAVRWGIGVENIDFEAFKDRGIPITNTPGVFGNEVADLALAYLLGLARHTHIIDRDIRANNSWPKPVGISTTGRKVAIVGFGSIGQAIARRVLAFDMVPLVYDPEFESGKHPGIEGAQWPNRLSEADFLVFSCPLNLATRNIFNGSLLPKLKPGVGIINVSRGGLIDEDALAGALASGLVGGAAFDVYQTEPLPEDSPFRQYDSCILGSHNGSTTIDAIRRVSELSIQLIKEFLQQKQ